MPSYTTRMMLAFLLLALLAGSLGIFGTYRIRLSLERMQVKFEENRERLALAGGLHKSVGRRRLAESMYIRTREKKYERAWDNADKDFSRFLSGLKKTSTDKTSLSALNAISKANQPVRASWLLTAAEKSPGPKNLRDLQKVERLESLVDDFTSAQGRSTSAMEEVALGETNLALRSNLLFSGFVLGLAVVMALYVSETLRRPLADLMTATRKISQGQLGHRIDLRRGDEIGALTSAFDEMSSELHRKDIQITGQLEQLKKATSLLERYSADLEKKNEEMEGFIYSVSHDLKAPLIAIQGFLAMFAEEFSSALSSKATFYLQRVEANGQQMQTLIAQLLELSRAGQPGGHFTTVSSKELVLQVLDNLHLQIEAKGAEVSMTGDWPSIIAEPNRIKQALTNLVDNALHYGQGNGQIKIDIAIETSDDLWRFLVKDNGIGIDPIYQAKVFDMFERLSDSHEKNADGTGIGLAIVKKIAESHGGTARVKSILGRGSTFYFEISSNLKAKDKANEEVRI